MSFCMTLTLKGSEKSDFMVGSWRPGSRGPGSEGDSRFEINVNDEEEISTR